MIVPYPDVCQSPFAANAAQYRKVFWRDADWDQQWVQYWSQAGLCLAA